MPTNLQSRQERDRKVWMDSVKKMVRNARSNLKSGNELEEAELQTILGTDYTVLLDKVQYNPANANIKVEVQRYNHVATKGENTWNFPQGVGTAFIKSDGTGSLSLKTPIIILPYRSEAPQGQRIESEDQKNSRHAMNDFVAGVFAEEGVLESAKIVQARLIVPVIHHHEDGTTSPCVYIMADNIFSAYRGRLEYSRKDFMSEKEELPLVNEDDGLEVMDDEMVAALTA